MTDTIGPTPSPVGSEPDEPGDAAHAARDHGWGIIREDRVQFSDLRVRRAAEFVEKCGIADELQAMIAKTTGRPRLCTVQGLLVGMTLCSRRNGNGAVFFNQVTDILHWAIPEDWRHRFKVPERPDNITGFEAAYAVVRRLFGAIVRALDPSPLPKNKRLTLNQVKAYFAGADPELLQEHREALTRISNRVVQASLASVEQHLTTLWDGSVGVDATPIETFARGVSAKRDYTSTDPDAGYYVREGDHRDPDLTPSAPRPRGRRRTTSKTLWGYDATLAVARNPHRDPRPMPGGCGDPEVLPALTVGFILDKPGHSPGPNGIAVLEDIRRRGHPAGDLAADAAYNNSKPEDWQVPLRKLGYRPTYDYRIDQLGKIDSIHGANQIEGTWYCPSMPTNLVDATIDHRRNPDDPKAIDQETWRARIDARTQFALAPKGKPNDNGRQRYMCPATAGRVQCPLKQDSLGTNPSLREVDPFPSPVGPPKICEQTSISVNIEDGAKHWQPRPYGSPEWQDIYGRLRNTVEGMNGYAKADAYEGIEHGGNRRIRGIAAQTLLLAFQLAHVNERKINAWLATLPGPDGKPHRRARHKTRKPRGSWTPTGHITPPAA
ncbi:hypothetical protein HUT06_00305 [Actinomadura sp. NAK00032]|uniref:hypothetical protein n=1 Tax=Actinomadura sp. NAK00032 TaxID=2742128 RepID=UPI0015908F79|nr:hypothetical protein [Actinomadura sp. NAK00032]QKW32669.1 hypothetical protein HUT06_00305 [Actinomadura sp. NAK00032]